MEAPCSTGQARGAPGLPAFVVHAGMHGLHGASPGQASPAAPAAVPPACAHLAAWAHEVIRHVTWPVAGSLVDALEFFVAWFHSLPELMPAGCPWKLLHELQPPEPPGPAAAPAPPAGASAWCTCHATWAGTTSRWEASTELRCMLGQPAAARRWRTPVAAERACPADCSQQALQDIEAAHEAAVHEGRACYQDPATGFSVFTEAFLLGKQARPGSAWLPPWRPWLPAAPVVQQAADTLLCACRVCAAATGADTAPGGAPLWRIWVPRSCRCSACGSWIRPQLPCRHFLVEPWRGARSNVIKVGRPLSVPACSTAHGRTTPLQAARAALPMRRGSCCPLPELPRTPVEIGGACRGLCCCGRARPMAQLPTCQRSCLCGWETRPHISRCACCSAPSGAPQPQDRHAAVRLTTCIAQVQPAVQVRSAQPCRALQRLGGAGGVEGSRPGPCCW